MKRTSERRRRTLSAALWLCDNRASREREECRSIERDPMALHAQIPKPPKDPPPEPVRKPNGEPLEDPLEPPDERPPSPVPEPPYEVPPEPPPASSGRLSGQLSDPWRSESARIMPAQNIVTTTRA